MPSRDSANHDRPRQDWVEIPVPALVSEETFALAHEQLEHNKHHSPRRTTDPTLLQGMLVCQECGYALYRSSTKTSKRKINYYRCIGSDGYRRLKGPVCRNRPIRQDYLDEFVWTEVIRLLDDPALIQTEINRRIEAARNTDPVRKREQSLRQRPARLENSMERLVTAYQEELILLTELRRRMPNLRKQHQAIESELRSLELAAVGPSDLRSSGRNVIRFSGQTPCPSRHSRCSRAPEDSPAGRQRDSGRRPSDPNPPLDSSVRFRSWNVWHWHAQTNVRLTSRRVPNFRLQCCRCRV